MSATLKLTRQAATPLMEIHRGPFDIIVDDSRMGAIEDQEQFETPIDPGSHTLQVRTGRWSGRIATFAAAPDDAIVFRCRGRRAWPILLASPVFPRVALKLVRE